MFLIFVSVGLMLLACKYHNKVSWNAKQLYHSISKRSINSNNKENKKTHRKELTVCLDKIIVADSPEKCDYAVQHIQCNLSNGLLGFDCGQINQGPVFLLQLATCNGVCALFRLNKIGYIPTKLKELLTNRHLLKVGVALFEGGKRIDKNYNCQVLGTLDLRILANCFSLPSPKSLAALCVLYLGFEMNKVLKVKYSNWNAETLTDEQIAYASYDAYASILIYHQICKKARQKRSLWENLTFYIKSLHNYNKVEIFDLPNGIIDTRFNCIKDRDINNISNNELRKINKKKISVYKNTVSARNKPLYDNCYLQAPDGEVLCTCDKKKAEWYISKQLGEVVHQNPFTVKLKFEPSGRALGDVGKYYTQVKINQCVVCGASDKFIKKNVVPREYRKYFPLVMKSHQSHDILLLCPTCHEVSNCHDLQLRKKLAILCDKPLLDPLLHINDEMLQSVIKVLKEEPTISHKRRKKLEMCVTKLTNYQEMINFLNEQFLMELFLRNNFLRNRISKPTSSTESKYQPHGLKVVHYFQHNEGGLVELERLWREHFLSTLKPKFLPELWSICHNQERLNIRQIQNRIEPSDARVAGIKYDS
ncbi:PREDICTED: exonuclease 3'-5' domain-containing protein 2 [Ceratosolen solmsi marchali]|uniref:Exonuclease 3'-5' domain-containing protein 2 n=1 Tax=Ceratosolen solmsi marchali TaxID=326594 RepID=A0AAJ7DVN8_9HYME|nr:PREDICTED: exonuclease 3'-5' domain-containing protein 2 [Ceratosolen solmsi marchali]XP_011498092.1 PREDICTED: exonuclease 3'-5' domain-containing protein 2 [Ceratosolen solmsi marchali]